LIPSTKNARRRAAPQTSLRAFSTDQLSPFRSIPGFPQHEILQNIAPLAARKWAAARAARDLAIHRFWIGLCPDSAVRSLTMRATKCWFGTPPASNPPRLTRPHFTVPPTLRSMPPLNQRPRCTIAGFGQLGTEVVSYRINRQFSGWNLPPLMSTGFRSTI
jgi:hypothetical protein